MVDIAFDAYIESQIEAFELAIADGNDPVSLRDYLPTETDEKYLPLLTELIRVDLELAYAEGTPKSVDDYLDEYPSIFESPAALERVAFEEFRLRSDHGEPVSTHDYATRYEIDTSTWERWAEHIPSDEKETKAIAGAGVDSTIRFRGSTAEVPDAARHPALGSTWHGFKILRRLGAGSFGEALLAEQSSLSHRQVVLKFSRLDNFEAQRLAELQHTNIVPIYSTHVYNDRTVLCMPFLGEHTLADFLVHLRTHRRLISDEISLGQFLRSDIQPGSYVAAVLRLTHGIADGLEHSHRRGIIHRDVKPANILLCDDGQPMLLDFNLAERRNEVNRTVGGTIPYMAPEQLNALLDDREFVDHRADVYSIGVVLFELLTGRLPFPAPRGDHESEQTVPDLIRSRRADILTDESTGTPAVWSIVRRCLAFDPDARYQSAAHLREDLRRHLHDEPLQHAPNSLIELVRKWIRRHPKLCSWSSAVVVLAIASMLVATAWLYRERQFEVLRATQTLRQFQDEVIAIQPALCNVSSDAVVGQEVIQRGVAIYDRFNLGNPNHPPEIFSTLDVSSQQLWSSQASRLAFLIAAAEDCLAKSPSSKRLEEALRWNQKARAWSKDNVILVSQQRRLSLRQKGAGMNDNLAKPNAMDALDPLISGMEQLRRSELDAATSSFRAATQRDPQNATNWLMLAESLTHQQQFERAIAAFDVAAAMLPDSVIPIYQRGMAHLNSNDHRAAIADFSEVLRKRPELCRARLNRGLAYLGLGDVQEALEELNAAIEQGCQDTRALLVRARLLRKLGDGAAAQNDVDRAMETTPQDVEGWLARGVARQVRDPHGAIEDFHRALDCDPFSSAAWQNIAHCQSELLGNLPASLDALNTSIELDPRSNMGYAGRGVLHARMGDFEAALADARQLANKDLPPILQFQVGCIHALCSTQSPAHVEESITYLAKAIQRDAALGGLARWDPDLRNISDDPKFQAMLEAAETMKNLAEPATPDMQQRDEQPKNES